MNANLKAIESIMLEGDGHLRSLGDSNCHVTYTMKNT